MKLRELLPVLCAMSFVAVPTATQAQAVPHTISFSGRLVDSGSPVTGDHDFTFRLWTAATGGSRACSNWEEVLSSVTVDNGLVFLDLGTQVPVDANCFTGATLYLEVAVDTTTLQPRIALGSVPYAIRAEAADDAATVGGHVPTDFRLAADDVPWGEIAGVPSDLDTNAETLCGAGTVLTGDGNCVALPTDSNAWTLCGDDEFLNGDGTCDAVPVDSNAATICAANQFLNGDGTCDPVPTDSNAGTLCPSGDFLNGDGACERIPVSYPAVTQLGTGPTSAPGRLMFDEANHSLTVEFTSGNEVRIETKSTTFLSVRVDIGDGSPATGTSVAVGTTFAKTMVGAGALAEVEVVESTGGVFHYVCYNYNGSNLALCRQMVY